MGRVRRAKSGESGEQGGLRAVLPIRIEPEPHLAKNGDRGRPSGLHHLFGSMLPHALNGLELVRSCLQDIGDGAKTCLLEHSEARSPAGRLLDRAKRQLSQACLHLDGFEVVELMAGHLTESFRPREERGGAAGDVMCGHDDATGVTARTERVIAG